MELNVLPESPGLPGGGGGERVCGGVQQVADDVDGGAAQGQAYVGPRQQGLQLGHQLLHLGGVE